MCIRDSLPPARDQTEVQLGIMCRGCRTRPRTQRGGAGRPIGNLAQIRLIEIGIHHPELLVKTTS
eukprot:2378045-Alexandrium_andersonii.AAC.1